MITPAPGDASPETGAPTDIAPLGSTSSPETSPATDWTGIAASADFQKLLRDKARFILPVTIFFLVYYFALPVLVGWFPELMKTKIGSVNLAYLFALSQFLMAWTVAALYVKKAGGWDKAAAAILAKFNKR